MNLRPTRRITKSHWSVTGKKTGNSHRFESALERDYITLIEFDDKVESYVEQPFTIHYFHDGKDRIYTPDFLVIYKSSANIKPLLCEIKYSADLQLNESAYQPKFNAAINYANENGYQFDVITEDEIRNIHLQNAAFLNRYRIGEVDGNLALLLITNLLNSQENTPESIIIKCRTTENHKERSADIDIFFETVRL